MDNPINGKMDNLAALLPEGLTENAVDEIAKLVDSVIMEKVGSEVEDLTIKINSFLRMKVDEIKDLALKELQQDEEFVRNGQIFESLKTFMSININQEDSDTAISNLVGVNEEAQETISKLTEEVELLLVENEKILSVASALKDQADALVESNAELKEEAKTLVESQALDFVSSEKAVMVSNVNEGTVDADDDVAEVQYPNEFLTKEVMSFMPIAEK